MTDKKKPKWLDIIDSTGERSFLRLNKINAIAYYTDYLPPIDAMPTFDILYYGDGFRTKEFFATKEERDERFNYVMGLLGDE